MRKHGGLTAIAQSLLEYVEDLLTASPKESFTKVEMLVLINAVKNDRDLLGLLEWRRGSGSQGALLHEPDAQFRRQIRLHPERRGELLGALAQAMAFGHFSTRERAD